MFKEKELEEIQDSTDDDAPTKMGWVFPVIIIGGLLLLLVFGAVQRGLVVKFSQTANAKSGAIIALVGQNYNATVDGANLLVVGTGYTTIVFSHCDDLDTALAFGNRYDAYVVDERAPVSGMDCLTSINHHHVLARVVCLTNGDWTASPFKQVCSISNYPQVKRDAFFMYDGDELIGGRAINILLSSR